MPSDGSVPQAAGWFPAVGPRDRRRGLRVREAGADRPAPASLKPLLVAALVVAIWALLTRMLHLDGLADVADGFWGSHDRGASARDHVRQPHRARSARRRSRSTAIVEVAAISSIIARTSRACRCCWFRRSRASRRRPAAGSARPRATVGSGARSWPVRRCWALLPAVVVLLAAVAALLVRLRRRRVLSLGVFGVLAALGVPHVLASRFGGVTGDVLGASVLHHRSRCCSPRSHSRWCGERDQGDDAAHRAAPRDRGQRHRAVRRAR